MTRLKSSLPEPSASHTMEPEMKGRHSGQAAHNHPENHSSIPALWRPLSSWSQQVLYRWEIESSPNASIIQRKEPSGHKGHRVKDPGGDCIKWSLGFEIPCHPVEKDCVQQRPGNATQVTAAAMAVCSSPSYRHFYKR